MRVPARRLSATLVRQLRPRMNAPVLSEQITETLPRVSTLGSFLTIAFCFAMRRTPRARVTVTTMGSPSGIAATARDTVQKLVSAGSNLLSSNTPPIVNISSQLRFWMTPIRQITPITPNEIAESFFASSSIDSCSGVFLSPIYSLPSAPSLLLYTQRDSPPASSQTRPQTRSAPPSRRPLPLPDHSAPTSP